MPMMGIRLTFYLPMPMKPMHTQKIESHGFILNSKNTVTNDMSYTNTK